jgi:signal transduction histidine kinase
MVYGDKIILQDIIDEVLNNAIKYSPNGKSIYLKVSKNKCFVIIEVKNEGHGFSEEDKADLFKKFQKLSATPTGDEKATGLGLAYTKDYVDLHGGRIDLESELEKGATFTILLPIYKEIEPEGGQVECRSSNKEGETGQKKG